MARTGIPVSVLEKEDDAVITTLIDLFSDEPDEPKLDPNDPESWKA